MPDGRYSKRVSNEVGYLEDSSALRRGDLSGIYMCGEGTACIHNIVLG